VADDPLASALRLAGFALAHAVWSIEDGETLCTLALIERVGGARELNRYEAPTIADSLDAAFGDLEARLRPGDSAAVVFDGFVTPPGGVRTDALVVDLFREGGEVLGRIVQPYRPARRSRMPFAKPSGFALLGPPQPGDSFGADSAAEPLVLEGARDHPKVAERHFGG
jgi:hypothetical protein